MPAAWRTTRGVWTSLAGALLSLLWLSGPAVRASEAAIELEADLPRALQACVTTEQLRASYVEMLAAYGGEGTQARALRLRVSQQAEESGAFTLLITAFSVGREIGVRTLPVKASDCAALPKTLALVLVLLAQEAPPPPAAPDPDEPAPPPPPTPRPQPRAASPATPASLELAIGAEVLFGVMPHPAAALQLRAATIWRPVSLRLSAGVLWPQELQVAEGSIRWQSYELTLEACSSPLQPFEWLGLRLCAGPRAALMLARSRDFALQTKGAGVTLIYLGMVPEAAVRLGRATWLQLGAGVALGLLRPQFFVGLDGGERLRVFDEPALLRAELSLRLAQIF